MKWMHALRGAMALAIAMMGAFALADIDVPSDGSDGDLVVGVNETRTIDLGLATTGTWNQPGNGNGVYDPVKWAVVFKYNSVTIRPGGVVRFLNHPSNPPVVWLVKQSVFSEGEITVDGGFGAGNRSFSVPGPGGFAGGRGSATQVQNTAGRGPGASPDRNNRTAAYANSFDTSVAYGNDQILPLIGGSGASWNNPAGGGAGGGAILIAARQSITFSRSPQGGNPGIRARSQNVDPAGSGGAIRLVAETVSGTQANMYACWEGNRADSLRWGRIRIEAVNNFSDWELRGKTSIVPLVGAPQIWPSDTSPQAKILSIGGLNAPSDPRAQDGAANADMTLNTDQPVIVRVQCTNVPIANWKVQLKLVVPEGDAVLKECSLVEGNDVVSFWEASFTLPPGVSVIQPRAYKFQ